MCKTEKAGREKDMEVEARERVKRDFSISGNEIIQRIHPHKTLRVLTLSIENRPVQLDLNLHHPSAFVTTRPSARWRRRQLWECLLQSG